MFNLGSIGGTLYHFVTPGTGSEHGTLIFALRKVLNVSRNSCSRAGTVE